jgi:hypothetical protein
MFGIDKLDYDPALPASTDTVGAFVKAGTDGDAIASQTQNSEEWLNTASILYDTAGNPLNITDGNLDVNIAGVDIMGVYHVSTNPDPDNIGAIYHTRGATPNETNQTFRSTGAKPDADDLDPANIHALDTSSFLHGWDGTAWDRLTSTSGSLDVNITSSDITVDTDETANIDLKNQAITPDNVAEVEVKSDPTKLPGRKYLWVQNLGPREVYLGKTGVTADNGIRLGKNAIAEFRLGDAISLFALGTNATADDVRVMAAS